MSEDLRQLAESILSDITSDTSIANILLKTKVFAAKIGDKDLLEWVSNELNGYEDNIPEYRIIDAGVKIDVQIGFREEKNFNYPVEMIKEKKIRDRLYHMPIHNSISEIENLGSDEDSYVSQEIPALIWYEHMRDCINGNIQRAYQYSSIRYVKGIIIKVKSLLLDYLLKISENEEIQFNSLIKKEMPTTVNNISASVINTGNGSISTGSVTTIIGNNNSLNIDQINELSEIIKKLDLIMSEIHSDEYQEVSNDIKSELQKEAPSKNFLKRCFQAICSFASEVSAEVIANQITPLIATAISLL